MAAPVLAAVGAYLSAGSGTSAAIAVPSGVQAGDIILVTLHFEDAATITPPAGFALLDVEVLTTPGFWNYIFWKRATGADSGTYTFGLGADDWRTGIAARFTGCATTGDPWDVFTNASSSTSSSTTPAVSLTTTGADRLLVWAADLWDVSTFTAPTSYARPTNSWPSSRLLDICTRSQAVAGATGSVTGTLGTARQRVAWLIALRPPAGTTYDKTGGAGSLRAGSGAKSAVPANFINKAGGAASVRAGSGAKTLANIPPDLLPSDVLDLSYWHLTTPEDEGDGTAEQIDQPALDSYETSNFFADTVNGRPCVVFRAPVDGFSTSSSSGATRMELRQHRKSGYANAAMDPNGSGRWQMTITTSADPTSITGGSNPRQELIIAQIHGAGDSPIPLILSAEWTSGGSPVTPRVRVFKNGPAIATPIISGITTSTRLTFRIRIDADAGRLKVWGVAGEVTDLPPITTATPYDWPISDFTDQEGWYYKDGAYHKTTITSGSSGFGIAKITYLNVLEPGDPEEVFSVVYEKAGGAASLRAGSGAKTRTPATVYAKAGGAARLSAAAGAKTFDEHQTYDKLGGAARLSAGSGAKTLVPATTYSKTGGAAGRRAGAGAKVLVSATAYDELGGAAAGAAGTGSVDLAHATTYDRTGGAAATGAGSGAKTHTSIVVYVRSGGAATSAAGGGVLQTGGGIEYARVGGASASTAGSGARATQSADVHVRAGGASISAAGSGAQTVQGRVIHTRTGGASAAAASTGLVELVPAARHDRTGGAVVSTAATGTRELTASVVHAKTGGAAAFGAGAGVASIVGATVHARTGGAATRGSGIGLVEIIGPAVHDQTGGGVAVLVGSGRGRVGGRLRAAIPVALGQFRSGTPVRR